MSDSLRRDEERIASMLHERASLMESCTDGLLSRRIAQAAQEILCTLRQGGKVLVMGNGGSAAEAQHFAAELMGRFERDRRPWPVIALTTDTSFLTAQANDAGFDSVFERQIRGLSSGCADVVVAMSTSDVKGEHSQNIARGLKAAKDIGLHTVLLCSQKTEELLRHSDVAMVVPDGDTARIQEVHLAILHIISKLVEEELK
jgi:phosphoheptose isomerase